MADGHALLFQSTVATAPSPALSGTSLVVSAGDGAHAPTPPFNCIAWPANTKATLANSEIFRVDAVATDTFTIVRSQEGSSAQAIDTTYAIANTATPKSFTDVEVDPYIKDDYYAIASDDVLTVKVMAFLDSAQYSIDILGVDYEPETSIQICPGAITYFMEDPLILDSPNLIDTTGNPATVLWTDAARAPQTVSTLLIIGV